jgi:hypothetical protein
VVVWLRQQTTSTQMGLGAEVFALVLEPCTPEDSCTHVAMSLVVSGRRPKTTTHFPFFFPPLNSLRAQTIHPTATGKLRVLRFFA